MRRGRPIHVLLKEDKLMVQGQFPLGWTGWISLLSKGLSRIFSHTTVQKHLEHLGAARQGELQRGLRAPAGRGPGGRAAGEPGGPQA